MKVKYRKKFLSDLAAVPAETRKASGLDERALDRIITMWYTCRDANWRRTVAIMSSIKKKTLTESKKADATRRRGKKGGTRVTSSAITDIKVTTVAANGTRQERPRHINSETKEEREKRLAKRKALTLRAFQMAYENHRRRQAS